MIQNTDTIRHTIGAGGRFAVSLVEGTVRVRGVDGDEVRANVHYEIDARSSDEATRVHDAVRLAERRGDGFLEIEETRAEGSWPEALARLVRGGWRKAGMTVDVEVPRAANVRVRVVSGDAHVEGTTALLEVRSVSGDITVRSVTGDLVLDTVSGDARVTGLGDLSLRGRTVSGDVTASTPRVTESRLTTVSGDIELEGAFGAGEHRVESASGDLRLAVLGALTVDVTGIAADVRSDIEHRIEGSMGHRRVTVRGGGPEVRFRTMAGSLHLADARPMHTALVPAPPPPPLPDGPRLPVDPPDSLAAPEPPAPSAEVYDDRMAVLRAVERGEIGIDEALRKLEEATRA
jgi:hypothetical protein